MECLKCNKKIGRSEITIICCDCKRSSHSGCTRLSPDEVKSHKEKGYPWRCRACTKQKDLVREEYKKKVKKVQSGMGDTKEMEALKHKSLVCVNREEPQPKEENPAEIIQALKLKNERLAKEVETLSYRLDMAEQNTKRNSLEVCGIPDKKNENLLSIVKQIGSAIDFPIKDEMIDSCYRINRQGKSGHHSIILVFVRRFDKEGFLKMYRLKKGLNTKDIGRKEDSVIFIRESLSLNKQLLLVEARKVAKEMNFQGVGVINGEIFIKKTESVPAILIRDVKDLDRLLNPNRYNNVK